MDNLSSAFAALSDPTRRAIVKRLTGGPATVNEIARPFRITQQAVSKHLACLERARLIRKRRRGREHFCALAPDAIKQVADWANDYYRFWEENYKRLDALLDELQNGKDTRSKRNDKGDE